MDEAEVEKQFGAEFLNLWRIVSPHTIVSIERAFATYRACRHVVRYRISGDFAECGVFKGGMSLLAATYFAAHAFSTRHVWLYDTFSGMTAPTEFDGEAAATYNREIVASSLSDVKSNLAGANYPAHRLHFVEGNVCETLKHEQNLPEQIAVLRLDTDWYDSTKAELDTLYERVVPGGIVLCDDYGFWQGARIAVDEFVERLPYPVYLCRTDNCGIEFVKPA